MPKYKPQSLAIIKKVIKVFHPNACEDEQMSKATFYGWFNRFSEENDQVKDETRSEHPKMHAKRKTSRRWKS